MLRQRDAIWRNFEHVLKNIFIENVKIEKQRFTNRHHLYAQKNLQLINFFYAYLL